MRKTITSASKNSKAAKAQILPDALTPAVVQAILEDAVLSGVADEAAQANAALEGIPYLGETRRQALALAGIATRSDLEKATEEQIGSVKGIGMGNASKIKQWLAVQAKMPAVAQLTPMPLLSSAPSELAEANQQVQDVFQKLGDAAARLKEHLPAKVRDKALDRQLDKLDTVASELAEGPDTLSASQVHDALKTLDKIAALLEAAAGAEKLSPKKQAVLIEELRARRKRLQKTLGD